MIITANFAGRATRLMASAFPDSCPRCQMDGAAISGLVSPANLSPAQDGLLQLRTRLESLREQASHARNRSRNKLASSIEADMRECVNEIFWLGQGK